MVELWSVELRMVLDMPSQNFSIQKYNCFTFCEILAIYRQLI